MHQFIQRRLLLAAFPLAWLAGCATMEPPQDATAVLEQAEKAMGGTQLKSVRFAGTGSGATFGQAYQPGMAWPKINYSAIARVADYENGAYREDAARSRAEPNGGGAVPLMGTGEQRTTGMMRDGFAWNMVGPAPQPAARSLDERFHDLWTTPHGVLKAALRNKATMVRRNEDGKTFWAVSFAEPGRFTATALINAEGLVERIESRLSNPVMGDVDVVTRFSGYRDHMGIRFPARIEQSQGGFPVLDLAVNEFISNVRADIAVPDLVRAAREQVTVERVANGVWFVAGGSHNSVAIEMKDHLVLVESPLFDGRSLPVFEAVRKLAPDKPVRYVVNSHHHFDHAGGLRTAVSEGATLVTSAIAKPWFEKVFANPNWINPDSMARSGRKAEILAIEGGKRVFTDGVRTVELHSIEGSIHVQGFNMVYLPAERLLIEADAYTPGPPNAPPSNPVNANALNLVQNIERLGLKVDRILPLHGRVVDVAELYRFVGRTRP